MSNVPSPIEVTTWPQVVALGLLLAAFVIIPAVITHLQNRPIKKTLTQNNGGSSVKDYLDDITARLDRLENGTEEDPKTLTPPTHREDMHDA
jgi:Na+(H+)/acetate symporter ActP